MYVLLNGAFGVGKTTVARRLRGLLPGSGIFDPEWVGFVLRRLPGYSASDYQHLRSWRRMSVLGARSVGAFRSIVLIPMAFSDPQSLDEVRGGLRSGGRVVVHFCLTAPLDVVRERLALRGEPPGDARWAWVHRRAAECCAAHEGAEFATRVPTEGIPAGEVAADLARRIRAAR